jgi:AraC-like DNA-binding protein
MERTVRATAVAYRLSIDMMHRVCDTTGAVGDEEPLARGYAVTHPSGTVVPPQPPGWDQLLLAISGAMSVRTGSALWVVPQHRALWVPDGERHQLVLSGRTQLRNLYLRCGLVPLPASCIGVNVPALLRELVVHAVREAPLYASVPHHRHLVGLLGHVLSGLPAAPLQLPLPSEAAARHVALAILEDPADDRPIDLLARDAAASRRSIERRFRAETGLSPAAWRQRARVLYALRLLAEGRSVTSVAVAVGYSTPSAFAAVFRQHTGAPPSRSLRPSVT